MINTIKNTDTNKVYNISHTIESEHDNSCNIIYIEALSKPVYLINLGYYYYISNDFFGKYYFEPRYYRAYRVKDTLMVSQKNEYIFI